MNDQACLHPTIDLEQQMSPQEIREAHGVARCYSRTEILEIVSDALATDERFGQWYIPSSVLFLVTPVIAFASGLVSRSGDGLIPAIVALFPFVLLISVLQTALRHRRRGYVLSLAYNLRQQEEIRSGQKCGD